MTSSGEVASWRLGNHGVTLTTANIFAVYMVRGLVSARKVVQCWAFVDFIDLKYPCFKRLDIALSCRLFEAQAF